MSAYTNVNRAGIRAAFALILLIILALGWLFRFIVRAIKNYRAAHAPAGAA